MRISPAQYLNFSCKMYFSPDKKTAEFKQSTGLKGLNIPSQTFAAYSNINFQGGLFHGLSLKKSTKNYLRVSNYLSFPLENVPCRSFNRKKINAYNIDQMKYPYGSIGMKTDFSDLIQSRDFIQCAGLAIFDSKSNSQFLAHIYNKTYVEDIYDTLIKAFSPLSFKEKDRLSIFILPGCEKDTKYTLNHILKALDMIDDDLSTSVCYVHFNKKNYDCLSLHEGRIFASDDIYEHGLTNTENMCYFNNPVLLGQDYIRGEISKLLEKNEILAVQKVNRVYADFKLEKK